MNYHLKSSVRNRREYTVLFYAVSFFIVILFGVHILFPSFLPGLFSALAYPLYKSEQALVHKADLMFLSKEELVNENNELRRKITELENSYHLLPVLKSENEELKSMLSRATTTKNKILARVLVRPPTTLYDTLVLDIGTDEGVENGDRVYAHGNVLLGEIAEVSAYTSKVKLYSSPGEKFDISIGKDLVASTATGRGNGAFEVTLPRELDIAEGDPVIIPAIQPTLFGTVSAVFADPVRAFQLVLFKVPVNIQQISWVLIERGDKDISL